MTNAFCTAQLKNFSANAREAFKRTNYAVVYDKTPTSGALVEILNGDFHDKDMIVLSPSPRGIDATGRLTRAGHAEIKAAFHDVLPQVIWENAFGRPGTKREEPRRSSKASWTAQAVPA